MRILLITIAALALGCDNKHDGPPVSVTPEMIALADHVRDAMVDLGNDIERAGTDCAKASALLKAGFARAKAFKAEGEAMKSKLTIAAEAEVWFKERYAKEVLGALSKMKPTAKACITDKAFAAAMTHNPLLSR